MCNTFFLKYAEVVNLKLGWILSAGCLVDINFYDNLLTSTIVPLMVVGVVVTSYKVSSMDEALHKSTIAMHLPSSGYLFLVHATVSSIIFQTFACIDIDDGKSCIPGGA